MLKKLAFKNARKNVRDFTVYFFTLVFAVCIFYMFNSIYDQQKIMKVTSMNNESLIAVRKMVSIVSIFVAVILGFLIVYANQFFMKRRKKEMGIYLTLGMEKRTVSIIFIMETFFVAIIAMIVGLVVGVFGSQFMSIFTSKIFEADMSSLKFIFSSEAMIKSIVYFGLIFVVVIIFNSISISKYKLIDLIYGGRQNEKMRLTNLKIALLLGTISIVLLVVAYCMILKNGLLNINVTFIMSIILGCVGTVLFFFSLAGMFNKIIQWMPKLYYRNLNMFLVRQLNSKINTNFVTISLVCLILFLTIGIFSVGYNVQEVMSNTLKDMVRFDVTLVDQHMKGDEFKKVIPYLEKDSGVDDYGVIKKYESDKYKYSLLEIDFPKDYQHVKSMNIDFITLSDYNKSMKMQGLETVDLPTDEFALLGSNSSIREFSQNVIDQKKTLAFDQYTLSPYHKFLTENVENNMEMLTLVIPDQCSSVLKANRNIMLIKTKTRKAGDQLNEKLTKLGNEKGIDKLGYSYKSSRSNIYSQSVTAKAVVAFLAIYLGIVFMVTCAAVLAIQQLSEAADNKERYTLLNKLGADERMVDKGLFIQILCYFLLPLVLAVVHACVGLKAANDTIRLVGQIDLWKNLLVTSAFILAFYGVYFVVTYVGSRNIIKRK